MINSVKRIKSFEMKQAINAGNVDEVMNYAMSGFDITKDVVADVPGWDALHYAVYKENLPIIIYLIVRGADPNGLDGEGLTPLHLAARTNRQDIIQHLLAHGADIHAESVQHSTPLHEACVVGNIDTVITLIDRGADANARNADNDLPIDLARENGHDDLVSIMQDIAKQSQARNNSKSNNSKSNNSKPNNNSKPSNKNNNNSKTNNGNKKNNNSNNSNKPNNSTKLFDKLNTAAPHYKITQQTEFIGDDVLPLNTRPSNAVANQKYFFDTKDVRCEIVRAFDGDILDHMRKQRRTPRNPYTNRNWPLDDTIAMKSTLKKLPSSSAISQPSPPSPPPPPSPMPAKLKSMVSYNKKHYKLRLGDKGGQYILVNGKRIYFKPEDLNGFEAVKTSLSKGK